MEPIEQERPACLTKADRLEIILCGERAARLRAQMALVQHELQDAEAQARSVVRRVNETYHLGDRDTFHLETGEITRASPPLAIVEAPPVPAAGA